MSQIAVDSLYECGTPSKGRRGGSSTKSVSPNTLLTAAIILGVCTVSIVGYAMNQVILAEDQAVSKKLLPGAFNSGATASEVEEHHHRQKDVEEEEKEKSSPYLHSIPQRIELLSGSGVQLSMPTVGLGTAGLGDDTAKSVFAALQKGYRRVDSAQAREWYREDLVGKALAQAAASKNIAPIPRDQIFITTKVHPRDFGAEATEAAMARSFNDLGTAYVDMVLLHYPECWGDLCGGKKPQGTWQESWAYLESLAVGHADKNNSNSSESVKCIGVSNFRIDHLEELLSIAKIKPCLVQSNYEPLRKDVELLEFCKEHGIQFESYSTLGGQYGSATSKKGNPVLGHPVVVEIANERGKSAAQVVLRWALQSGMTVVPRTQNVDHLVENADVFDFDLTDDEMARLDDLEKVTK